MKLPPWVWGLLAVIVLIGIALGIYFVTRKSDKDCEGKLFCGFKADATLEVDKKGIREDPEAMEAFEGLQGNNSDREFYTPGDKKNAISKLYPYMKLLFSYTTPPNQGILNKTNGWRFEVANYKEQREMTSLETLPKYTFAQYDISKDPLDSDTSTAGVISNAKMIPEGSDYSSGLAEITDESKMPALKNGANCFKASSKTEFSFFSGLPNDYDIFEEKGISVVYKYRSSDSSDFKVFGATSVEIPADAIKNIDISSGVVATIPLDVEIGDSLGSFTVEQATSSVLMGNRRTKMIFADMNHDALSGKDRIVHYESNKVGITTSPVSTYGLNKSTSDLLIEYLPVNQIPKVKEALEAGQTMEDVGFKYTKDGESVLLLRFADLEADGGYVGYESGSEKADMKIVNDKNKALLFVFIKANDLIDKTYNITGKEGIKARGKYILMAEPIFYDTTPADLQNFEEDSFDTGRTRFYFTLKKGGERVSTRKGLFPFSEVQPPKSNDEKDSKYIAFTFTQPLVTGIVPDGDSFRENVFLRLKNNTNNSVPYGIGKKVGSDLAHVYRSDMAAAPSIATLNRRFTVTKDGDTNKYTFTITEGGAIYYLYFDTTNRRLRFSTDEKKIFLTSSIYDDNRIDKDGYTEEGAFNSLGFVMCDPTSVNTACIYHGDMSGKTVFGEGSEKGARACPYMSPLTAWKSDQAKWTAANFVFKISTGEQTGQISPPAAAPAPAPAPAPEPAAAAIDNYTVMNGLMAKQTDSALNFKTNKYYSKWVDGESRFKDLTLEECAEKCNENDLCMGFDRSESGMCRFSKNTGAKNSKFKYYKKN
jgi:hypothetical protein